MPEWAKALQAERETTIQWAEDERIAHIYTASPLQARRLGHNPLAKLTQIRTDEANRITGMEFEIPVAMISVRTKRREMTPEQRSAATARLLKIQSRPRLEGQRGHPSGGPGPA
jgi:hypothetical protein